jgi:DNA polymerase
MSKQSQLKELNKKMLACKKCALRATCHQVVPGEGSANAKIFFIGEGPGKKEDELGRPFVGSAGKFLDEMLEIIKLKREDVYIANVVKCRPPQNRDPSPEEARACWPWLLKQIQTIQPRLIVTLGRHSMERFLPSAIRRKKISQMHGTLVKKTIPEIGPQNFYILYHPAAALYNGSMRKTLIKDFKKIPKVLEKIHIKEK